MARGVAMVRHVANIQVCHNKQQRGYPNLVSIFQDILVIGYKVTSSLLELLVAAKNTAMQDMSRGDFFRGLELRLGQILARSILNTSESVWFSN